MLTIILLGFGGLLALVVGFVLWRIVATVRASQHRTDEIVREIATVMEPLADGREPAPDEIARLARAPRTRNVLLEALQEHDREELFPDAFRAGEHIAESDLVFWLCHPNELQQAPDEIEFMGRFTRSLGASKRGDYYLFRFRVKEPHWAADHGWMSGVAGPYLEGHAPSPCAPGTFSELAPWESQSPDEHVDAVHRIMEHHGVYEDL